MTKENTLHLTLKKEWFDKIKNGEKKEEYREIKPYWISRFCEGGLNQCFFEFIPKKYDVVKFKNGYAKNAPKISVRCDGIRVEKNIETPLGKGNYFIIKLGDIVNE